MLKMLRDALLWIAALAWFCGAASAGPTSDEPSAPLGCWGAQDSVNGKLHAEASHYYAEAEKLLSALEKKQADGQIKLIKLAEYGKAHIAMLQTGRRARRLVLWGEPSGVDFEFRLGAMRNRFNMLIDAARPNFNELLSKGQQVLTNQAKRQRPAIAATAKLIEGQKLAEAEKRFLPVFDDLEAKAVWYRRGSPPESMAPYDEVLLQLETAQRKLYAEEARQAIADERDKLRPDFDGLLRQANAVASAVGRAGKGTLDGEELDGPQLVSKLAERWQAAHFATLRAIALDYAAAGIQHLPAPTIVEEYVAFDKAMLPALAGILIQDASRASADEAVELAGRYALALAPLAGPLDEARLRLAVQPGFDALSAKSALLANYEKATGDLLRWRARAAASAAAAAKKAYGQNPTAPPIDAHFVGPTPAVCETASSKLVGKKVAYADLLGDRRGNAWGAMHMNLHPRFGGVSLPVARLEPELLVTSAAPPLSLQAAAAIEATRRGDLAEAGGVVLGIELENPIVLFARATPDQLGLAHFGETPSFGPKPLQLLRTRVDVKPDWVRGQYFFQRLAAEEQ